MKPKVFTQGTGRLTADVLNDWQDTSRKVEQMGDPYQPAGWTGPMLCKVEASTPMIRRGDELSPGDPDNDPPIPPAYGPDVEVPNRWLYDLVQINMGSPVDSTQWTAGPGGTAGDFAINLAETANSDTHAMGVDLDNLPEGFELQPVADGTLVWAYFTTAPFERGSTYAEHQGFIAAFESTNQFDGEC